jgi:hypothetical protein
MQRAISEQEAQQVKTYYNKAADELGIARPLNSSDWYKIKAYLREKYSKGYPAEWTTQDTFLHVMACSNLAIDPIERRNGLSSYILRLLIWILSPSDRHGKISELLRILFILLITLLISGVANKLFVYIFGGIVDIQNVIIVMAVSIALIGIFISSNTMIGVVGLFVLLVAINSIFNINIKEEWLKAIGSFLGIFLGGILFVACLA